MYPFLNSARGGVGLGASGRLMRIDFPHESPPLLHKQQTRLTKTGTELRLYTILPLPISYAVWHMLGGWVNPHREQQTIPQGQTSSPPKSFFTPTAKARPDQAALATSAGAGATGLVLGFNPGRKIWSERISCNGQ